MSDNLETLVGDKIRQAITYARWFVIATIDVGTR